MPNLSPPAVEMVGAETEHRMRTLLALLGIPVLVLLSRLPFLSAGYGLDPDAWRVASVAHYLAHSGGYIASRFPGYPVQECVSALFSRGGPMALNAATAFFSALAVLFFILILRTLGCRDALLAALALACIPVIYVGSTITLDPIWALAFLLGATYMALRRRPWLAGIFLGLAVGCRITSALFLLPLCLILIYMEGRQKAAEATSPAAVEAVKPAAVSSTDARESEEDNEDEEQPMDPVLRAFLVMLLVTLAVSVCCYLPLLLNYGLAFFQYNYNDPPQVYIQVRHATTDVWGVLGGAALLLALASQLAPAFRRGARSFSALPAKPLLLAWVIALALPAAVFYRVPHQALYLIPGLPFALLLLGYLLPRRIFQLFCVALIFSPFLLTLRSPEAPSGPGTPRFKLMGHDFRVYLAGSILDDHHLRVMQDDFLQHTLAFSDSQPSRCWLIMLGFLGELNMVSLEHGGKMIALDQRLLHSKNYSLDADFLFESPHGKATYVAAIDSMLIHNLLKRKVTVYFVPGAEKALKADYGNIVRAGAKPMPFSAFE